MDNFYSEEDNEVWKKLITQQLEIVADVACKEYLFGLSELNLSIDKVPNVEELSKVVFKNVGWTLSKVDKLIPSRDFFNMLANKTFPVIQVIRPKEEINFYTNDAPDVFHELFGHCPMIMNKKFSEIMHKLGVFAINASDKSIDVLGKLFWVMFEFGIIDNKETKILGAGILPSKDEIYRVMHSNNIQKVPLNFFTKLDINIQGGIMQPKYYSIKSLDALYTLVDKDLEKLVFFNNLPESQYGNTFLFAAGAKPQYSIQA